MLLNNVAANLWHHIYHIKRQFLKKISTTLCWMSSLLHALHAVYLCLESIPVQIDGGSCNSWRHMWCGLTKVLHFCFLNVWPYKTFYYFPILVFCTIYRSGISDYFIHFTFHSCVFFAYLCIGTVLQIYMTTDCLWNYYHLQVLLIYLT